MPEASQLPIEICVQRDTELNVFSEIELHVQRVPEVNSPWWIMRLVYYKSPSIMVLDSNQSGVGISIYSRRYRQFLLITHFSREIGTTDLTEIFDNEGFDLIKIFVHFYLFPKVLTIFINYTFPTRNWYYRFMEIFDNKGFGLIKIFVEIRYHRFDRDF